MSTMKAAARMAGEWWAERLHRFRPIFGKDEPAQPTTEERAKFAKAVESRILDVAAGKLAWKTLIETRTMPPSPRPLVDSLFGGEDHDVMVEHGLAEPRRSNPDTYQVHTRVRDLKGGEPCHLVRTYFDYDPDELLEEALLEIFPNDRPRNMLPQKHGLDVKAHRLKPKEGYGNWLPDIPVPD